MLDKENVPISPVAWLSIRQEKTAINRWENEDLFQDAEVHNFAVFLALDGMICDQAQNGTKKENGSGPGAVFALQEYATITSPHPPTSWFDLLVVEYQNV